MAFEHQPGAPIECLSLMICLEKDEVYNPETKQSFYYSGFSIGGGIDQDYRLSPHNFPDHGIYVTKVNYEAPAYRAGLQFGDKILGCNGMDFTMCTHKQAVNFMHTRKVLNLLVARRGVTSPNPSSTSSSSATTDTNH